MSSTLTQKQKGFLTLLSTCFFYLVLGAMYIWGNISIYVLSYYKGVSSDVGSIVFPFSITISKLCCLLSFPIIKLIGFRNTLILSSVMMFAFLFASSFCPTFWSFFICFGIGFAGSTGLLYLTLLYNTYKYFPNKRGIIGGVVMFFYGMAALLSNYILYALINPDDVNVIQNPETNEYTFSDEIPQRLPSALRSLSYIFSGLMALGFMTQFEFKEPIPEEKIILKEEETIMNKRPDISEGLIVQNANEESELDDEKGDIPEEKTKVGPNDTMDSTHQSLIKRQKINKNDWSVSSTNPDDETSCLSLKDAFGCKVTYCIFAMIFCSITNGYFMAANFKSYGISKIPCDKFLTLVGSLSSVGNGGGRLFWGVLSDKLPFKKIYLIVLIIQIIESATIRFISDYKEAYLIWVFIALLCEGSHFVIFPPLCFKVFGPNVGSVIYSLLLIVCSCGNFAQYGINLAFGPLIGYDNEFYVFTGLTTISLILCIVTVLKFKRY